MIRVRCFLEILQVTSHARDAGQSVVVVDVAINALAGRNGVRVGQRESDRSVIELGIQPVVGAVAVVATGGEHRGYVVRKRRLLELGRMTGITLRRHRLEFAVRGTLVASIAIYGRVGAGQRETIIVLLNLLDRDLPSADRVALFAVSS